METVKYQGSDSVEKEPPKARSIMCHWPDEWPHVVWGDEVCVIDPEGDVLLKLQRTLPTEETTIRGTPGPVVADTADIVPAMPSILEQFLGHHSSNLPQTPALIEDGIASEDTSQLEHENELVPTDTVQVYLQVSSRHLILASSVFRTMLGSNTFLEGNKLRSQGNIVIELSDDPDALIILMHIIHGATRKVPRRLTLDDMVKVAVLVDYYHLFEAVDLFSDTWVKYLQEKAFPKRCNPDVMPWLFISWVFEQENAFRKATELLIRQGDDNAMVMNDLPIPLTIFNKIKEQRNEAIESIITILHDHITKYLTSDILCPSGAFDCDSRALGSLIKSSVIVGIWPRPFSPYHGMSFDSLSTQIQQMQVLDQCPRSGSYHGYDNGNPHQTRIIINASIKSLEDQYCGFELDSVLFPSVKSKKSGPKKGEMKKKKGGKRS